MNNQQAKPAAQPVTEAEPHGVHNLHWIGGKKILSGSVPEGGQGFDELKARGIRTIISVDGATPDVAAAKARGMRYVHIPIRYSDVTEQQKLDIARAVRDLPGPVYIHCHHGKHRSPAASAAVAISLGMATPEEGMAFLKTAGTAPSYKGLYASVAGGAACGPPADERGGHPIQGSGRGVSGETGRSGEVRGGARGGADQGRGEGRS